MEKQIRKILGLPYSSLYVYWQHYWICCINKLEDKDNVSFKIEGPRMLLLDLVEELDGHGFSNRDNIKYFIEKLSVLDKSDEVFCLLCHPVISCLLQELRGNNPVSCIILCKKALKSLADKVYFSLLVDWLSRSISEEIENTIEHRKRANYITHLIIAEFIAEGFILEEIKSFAAEIPKVIIDVGGMVMSAPDEFDGLKESDFETREEYYKCVSKTIRNWDVKKRLNVLKEYFNVQPRAAFCLIRLSGLKGCINDFVGDINIYSPKLKRYITSEYSISKIEEISEDRDIVNAAIPIAYTSPQRARTHAMAELEEVLDLLMLTYKTKTPIRVESSYAIVIEGKEVCSSISFVDSNSRPVEKKGMKLYLDSLDLAELDADGLSFVSDKHHVLNSGQNMMRRRLKNSAHWYSKADVSERNEDVLLYSWFAIEGLLKVDFHTRVEALKSSKDATLLKVIQEFVSSIVCKQYFKSYLRNEYMKFIYNTNLYNNYYDLPGDVIEKAGINVKSGDKYRDYDFLRSIPDLIKCVNDDIIRDELAEMQEFYHAKKGLEEKAKVIKNDILMIYRLRNMIVHNAALSCANLAFYAQEAKYLAQRVIWHVIDQSANEMAIDEIVLDAILDFQVFLGNYPAELEVLKGKD